MKYQLLYFLCFLYIPLSAQQLKVPTLSPRSEIKQEVGLTEITLSYARPTTQGRSIFGDLVPYGKIWRTGANASTKLTFTEEVQIEDHSVPAGTYALYTIPNLEEWTIIIHKETKFWSIAGDLVKPENDLCRFTAKVMANPQREESFTMQFKDIHSKGLTVELAWENTIVRFPITVEVDQRIADQMDTLLLQPAAISPRDYYFAAEYYYHNQKDLDQAVEWLDAALIKSPNNFRHGLLKSKILSKQGKKEAAIQTTKQAHEWAIVDENAHYTKLTWLYLNKLMSSDEQDSPVAKQDVPVTAIQEKSASDVAEKKQNITVAEVQEKEALDLVEKEQAAPTAAIKKQAIITKDIDYVADSEYDNQKDLLDIYMPEGEKDVPVIVYFHGGALLQGDKSMGEGIGNQLAESGIGLVSVNYRLSPDFKHPAHLNDVAKATAWVINNIKDYGGSPEKVYIGGHSAGAYLAALLAIDESVLQAQHIDLSKIAGSVLISPFLYVEQTAKDRIATDPIYKSIWGDDFKSWKQASVTPHISANRDNILLLYADGDDDWRKAQIKRFARSMTVAGNYQVHTQEVPNRDHISIITGITEEDDRIANLIIDFVLKK